MTPAISFASETGRYFLQKKQNRTFKYSEPKVAMILFLDYDGVLHPNNVYMTPTGIVLRSDGHNLFEHAELLADLLDPYPDVRIVLSTSWVWSVGFDEAKTRLPERLQTKIHGATFNPENEDRTLWRMYSRWFQVNQYVQQNNIQSWVAVDDDDRCWPEDRRHHLVHTSESEGIGDKVVQDELILKIESKINEEAAADTSPVVSEVSLLAAFKQIEKEFPAHDRDAAKNPAILKRFAELINPTEKPQN